MRSTEAAGRLTRGRDGTASRRTARRLGGALLILVAALAPLGCGGAAEEAGAPPPEPRRYEVEGLVRWVAPAEAATREIEIRHEAIPDFEDLDGEVVGMEAMSMRFTVAEGVDLAAVAPGDRVAFTLEVDWEETRPGRVVAIAAVPDEPPGQTTGEPDDTP